MKFVVLTVVAAATIGLAAGRADARDLTIPHKSFAKMTATEKVAWLKRQIHKDLSVITFWTNRRYLAKTDSGVWKRAMADMRWARTSLRIANRNLLHYQKLVHPPDDWAEFSCIHHYEGATNSNTGNGYYGGLQMDMGFQRTYGPDFLKRWGTADRWPVWAQVTAARRARDSGRGYGPWPVTRTYCGQ